MSFIAIFFMNIIFERKFIIIIFDKIDLTSSGHLVGNFPFLALGKSNTENFTCILTLISLNFLGRGQVLDFTSALVKIGYSSHVIIC